MSDPEPDVPTGMTGAIATDDAITTAAERACESDETEIFLDTSPDLADLAWSYEDALIGPDTVAAYPAPRRRHVVLRWLVVIAAFLIAATAVAWFGMDYYREGSSTPTSPSSSTVTSPSVPPSAPGPSTETPFPPPVTTLYPPDATTSQDPPHAPPKYPWVSVAVSNSKINHPQATGYGYGYTEDQATQAAIQQCSSAGDGECGQAATVKDGCVVAVLGNGIYESTSGPTRSAALAEAKTNFPWAYAFHAFCAWDGNDS